ncbi:hypothetical protein [Halomicrococcus gelatinilyticus]|uniref:hypothetical protein n=1 Tax=Halomicrococcus gelatinilyticus TaxID=1702103 RepID=UPI002E125121
MMKRDVLSVLMVVLGVLLSGTVPGLFVGAPLAVFGAYWLAEPRVQTTAVPDTFRTIAGRAR